MIKVLVAGVYGRDYLDDLSCRLEAQGLDGHRRGCPHLEGSRQRFVNGRLELVAAVASTVKGGIPGAAMLPGSMRLSVTIPAAGAVDRG